uniref:Protein Wnt n=2 Tax=Strigamia maritima TaxID=126957 RepID=T1JI07_STRMM
MKLLRFVLFLAVFCISVDAIKWLALSQTNLSWNVTSHCSRARKYSELVSGQAKFCKRHIETMPYIISSAAAAIRTCQYTFADRRWNCSSINTAPRFTPDLTTDTREQAFVTALSSAAVVNTISIACSSGLLASCGCAPVPQEPAYGDFKWGGCGDDIKYGLRISKSFTDAPWRGKKKKGTLRAAVNRHNSDAGRQIIHDNLRTQCKCHGVSGSCNVRTCWRALPSMEQVAMRLKTSYAVAVEVVNKKPATKMQLLPAMHRGKIEDMDLVYITKSPDYCSRDPRFGSVGTKGRRCNTTSEDHDSCDSMCCGRGFRTFSIEIKSRCRCKYVWCCFVKCKICSSIQQVHECY